MLCYAAVGQLHSGLTTSRADLACVLQSAMEEQVASIVASVLGSQVAPSQPLMEAGLDSLGAVELRNALSAAFAVQLPPTVTLDYPSIAALAAYIASVAAPIDAQEEASFLSATPTVRCCAI